jgi:large subunit ribosomal protein L21
VSNQKEQFMFAIIETGGKQISVKNGDTIFIEKIDGVKGDKVTFDKILLFDKTVGKPYVEGAKVTGIIEKQGKERKVIIYRTKRKSN